MKPKGAPVTFSLADLRRLAGVLARLGSPHDGEKLAAAHLADQFIRDRKVSWSDVLHAEPPLAVVIQPTEPRYWRQCAEELLFEHQGALSAWEETFLQSILERGRGLSARQEAVLLRIASKCGAPTW